MLYHSQKKEISLKTPDVPKTAETSINKKKNYLDSFYAHSGSQMNSYSRLKTNSPTKRPFTFKKNLV